MVQATAPAAPETATRRTKNGVMATTIITAHGFEHLFSNTIPLLTTQIALDLELTSLQVGAIVAVRSAFAGITSVSGGDSFPICSIIEWPGCCPPAPSSAE